MINPDVKVDDPPAGKVIPDKGGIVPIDVAPTDTQVTGTGPVSPPPTDDVEDLDDQVVRVGSGTVEQMDPLLATGAEVNLTGEVVSEGIFSVDGRVLEVNGERVLVMDYGDADALDAEAAGISHDGSSVATHGKASMILWAASPHFFRSETAIVLYVGDSPDVIEALTSVLGPQFAGR